MVTFVTLHGYFCTVRYNIPFLLNFVFRPTFPRINCTLVFLYIDYNSCWTLYLKLHLKSSGHLGCTQGIWNYRFKYKTSGSSPRSGIYTFSIKDNNLCLLHYCTTPKTTKKIYVSVRHTITVYLLLYCHIITTFYQNYVSFVSFFEKVRLSTGFSG